MKNKKKVAIATLGGKFNYGNRLQNYALQFFINKNFKDMEVFSIENTPFGNQQKFLVRAYRNFKSFIKPKQSRSKTRKFNAFNKNINFDKTQYYFENSNLINQKYDYVVVGSDQVWNEEMSNNLITFLLPYVDKEKRISYAASIAKKELSSFEKGTFKRYLNTFKSISVREGNAAELLQPYTKKQVEVLVDPTLLLTKQEWAEVERKPFCKMPEKYVLACFLSEQNEEAKKLVLKIKELGYEVIDVTNPNNKYGNIGPAEFLYLERNASLILTDSFHSIVFSIINKVPVVHIEREGNFSSITARIENLERIFNVKFKTLKDAKKEKVENLFKFNLKNTDEILNKEREKSLNFLTHAFNDKVEKNNNLTDVDFDCSGCGLCKNICPVGAISLQENEKGFIHPVIDKQKCVNCGLCLKNCSQLRSYEKLDFTNGLYALKRKDNAKGNFSSTGIFGSIAKKVLSENGAVFGVEYQKENSRFVKIESEKNLSKIEGSKYFQVDVSNIYKEIEKCLAKNQKVLVGATPCQIAGLRRKFKYNNNLILVQVVCHGVPSQKLFNQVCLERFNEIPKKVNFRAEGKNFFNYNEEYYFTNKILAFNNDEDLYINVFLKNVALNESCYNCRYAGNKTGADIIIGDCWGIKQINKNFYTDKGVSILTFNTSKGKGIFESLKENYDIYKIPKNKYQFCNENLFKCAVNYNNLRKHFTFFEDIKSKKIKDSINYNIKEENKTLTFFGKVKRKIKKILKIN
ncbi:MAG: polysaccharide pyruvyl transferase family protein [Clostridia bacterium]|nr:polysaccharide pyruvyl transferase family protein [Clostridia bacterium]